MQVPSLPQVIPITCKSGRRILLLSLEILERIFYYAQPSPEEEDPGALLYAPYNVLQVCQNWRNVALRRHGMWTNIGVITYFNTEEKLVKDHDMVETYLSRSGCVLLLEVNLVVGPRYASPEERPSPDEPETSRSHNMRLGAASMNRYIHLLMPVRHRLRKLFLKLLIDDPCALEAPLPGAQTWKLDKMPELELLCVTFPTTNNSSEAGTIDLSACSERLCECYIFGCLKVSLADGIELSNLTTLSYDFPGNHNNMLVASWFSILSRMPRLQTLDVTIKSEGFDWFLPEYYIQLPMLEEFSVYFTAEAAEEEPDSPGIFIEGLWCPKLKSFLIACNYRECLEERRTFYVNHAHTGLYRFLRNNGEKLERLCTGYDLMYEYELGSALVHWTSLRNLLFLRMRFAENSELLKVLDLEHILEDSQVHGEDIAGPWLRRSLKR